MRTLLERFEPDLTPNGDGAGAHPERAMQPLLRTRILSVGRRP